MGSVAFALDPRGEDVHLRRSDELADELAVGGSVDLDRRAFLNDLAEAQDDHPVGQGHRLDLVVGHVDGGGV